MQGRACTCQNLVQARHPHLKAVCLYPCFCGCACVQCFMCTVEQPTELVTQHCFFWLCSLYLAVLSLLVVQVALAATASVWSKHGIPLLHYSPLEIPPPPVAFPPSPGRDRGVIWSFGGPKIALWGGGGWHGHPAKQGGSRNGLPCRALCFV